MLWYIDEWKIFKFIPWVSKRWHPTKNGDLMPENVTYGSKRKFGGCAVRVMNIYQCQTLEHLKTQDVVIVQSKSI